MAVVDKATIVWALIATDLVITGFDAQLHVATLHYNATQSDADDVPKKKMAKVMAFPC